MTTQDSTRLVLGDHAPAFSRPATDGKTYSLGDLRDRKLLVTIFLANHCPYVGAWEDRILAIAKEYGHRGVAFLGVCSNDAEKYPQDGFDAMRTRVEEKGYPFPYLYDEDGSVAHSFGATRTPEVYIFDEDRRLVYHGAVDSDWEEGAETQHYLREALNRLLVSGDPPQPETPAVGCKIVTRT